MTHPKKCPDASRAERFVDDQDHGRIIPHAAQPSKEAVTVSVSDEDYFRLMAEAIREVTDFDREAQRVAAACEAAFRLPGGER